MKPMIRNSMIAALAVAALSTQAYSSDRVMTDRKESLTSFKTVIELVQKEGYGDIYEIENEYGFFKAKVRDANGDRLKLAIIPETQAVKVLEKKSKKYNTDDASAAPKVTLDQALNILAAQGYTSIEEIEFEKGYYEADIRDQDGHKKEMMIDAQTGEILSQWKAFFR
ncbi:PepSY domain-containing protein [Terasakiella pusilla]|uniref:PepSY domain-containing protein n=1 Tax=Terasakiella pusilla TaxID=64973 RepID=UPI003AA9078B